MVLSQISLIVSDDSETTAISRKAVCFRRMDFKRLWGQAIVWETPSVFANVMKLFCRNLSQVSFVVSAQSVGKINVRAN